MQVINTAVRAAHIVTANKQLVDTLLEMNTHNRAIKQSHVDYLAGEIRAGRWKFTNQGIGVSKSGVGTDGQHRLKAICQAGYPPVDLLIVTGLDDDAQTVVDTHSRRSQADVIKLILDRSIGNQIVAAVNVILKIQSRGDAFTMQSGRISEKVIAEYIDKHSEVVSAVSLVIGNRVRASVTAALIEYAIRYDIPHAEALADQIKTGANLDMNSPAYRLLKWMERNKAGGQQLQAEAYAVTVTACIAHAQGRQLSMLRPSGSWSQLPKPPAR